MAELLSEFIFVAKYIIIPALDMELSELLIETVQRILGSLIEKQSAGIDPSELVGHHLQTIFEIIIKCLAVLQNFRL